MRFERGGRFLITGEGLRLNLNDYCANCGLKEENHWPWTKQCKSDIPADCIGSRLLEMHFFHELRGSTARKEHFFKTNVAIYTD